MSIDVFQVVEIRGGEMEDEKQKFTASADEHASLVEACQSMSAEEINAYLADANIDPQPTIDAVRSLIHLRLIVAGGPRGPAAG